MQAAFATLCGTTVLFDADLLRNITAQRDSWDIFDDLADNAFDQRVAEAAVARGASWQSPIAMPFDRDTVISYSFDAAHWQKTRFSDGRTHGAWYGSLDLKTTVCETAFHWRRLITDCSAGRQEEIIGMRHVFSVACIALLLDLRGRDRDHPELVDRGSYAFCQALGAWLVGQGQNGLLTPSARCLGTNGVLFRQDRLSNVRDFCTLTYRTWPGQDVVHVQRTPGRTWLSIRPSELA